MAGPRIQEFAHRYDGPVEPPTVREALRDLARRALLPAAWVWTGIVALGFLIVGPLGGFEEEVAVNEGLAELRDPTWDGITFWWSTIGGTQFIVLGCVAVVLLLWWRTRRWWFAAVPALAVSLQSAVFVTSSFVVGRERPDVELLDHAPPTSSFPSGHAGASTAFYLTLALLAQRLRSAAARWSATALCLAVPLLVSFARLYRGMHHPTDVLVGVLNGVLCAWFAWRYLRVVRPGS